MFLRSADQDEWPTPKVAAHEIECVPRYLRVRDELLITVSQDDPRLLNIYTPRLELRKIHFCDERREVWERSLFPRFVPDDATPRLFIDGVELPRDENASSYEDAAGFWADLCLLFSPDCIISTAKRRRQSEYHARKKRLRRLSDYLAEAVPYKRPGCLTIRKSGNSCVK